MQEHNHARQEIAAQLRQVRKEQGMTQERLAEKVAGGLGREIEVKVT